MVEVGHTPFWAKCSKCQHCWVLYNTPIDLGVAGKLMKRATCTACGASGKAIVLAKQDAGVLLEGRPAPARIGTVEERAAVWRRGGDIGSSSKALWSVMTGVEAPDPEHPHDPDDLGRCLRLLDLIPEWKERLHLMRGLSKYWDALVARWADLEATMAEEVGIAFDKGAAATKTYELMRAILKPVEDADDSFFRLGPGMSVRFGSRRTQA